MKVLNSYEKRKEGQNDGTVYCNRDELCRLQFQSGKGGIEGRRSHFLFGKLTDEFHGRGRDGFSGGHHPGSGSSGVWGLKERSAGRGSEGWRFWRGAAGNAEELETPVLNQRLIWSLGFLVVLMYFSMGHMMWNWPVPAWMEGNHIAMGLLQMILAAIVMVINQKFFISGFKSLWHKAPNMDTLVALGSMASFGYSTYALSLIHI